MDRSTDGGMAPALQSSNHQSTELTDEGEVNQAESALLHKNVNGKSYKVDSPLDEKTTQTGVADITLHLTDTEERGPDKINKDTGLDSCFSSGLKKIASEGVMPKLQIGQGDSVVGHIGNCNGWGNSKKSAIDGILQESNNLSAVRPGIKISTPMTSPLKCGDSGANLKISCNGDSENRNSDQSSLKSNGHTTDQQTPVKESLGTSLQDTCREMEESNKLSSCVKGSACHEPADSEILSAGDKCSGNQQSVFPAESSTCTLNREMMETGSASESGNSKCGPNTPIDEECVENSCTKSPLIESSTSSDSIPKPVNCPNSSNADNDEQSLTHTLESADNMFLYSQILPGDLTRMNMSDNLTNTLQELAASLKEASFPLQLDVNREIVSREASNTVNTDNDVVDTLHSSAKSLDFREDDCTERETRILDRTSHAAHCVGILEHRLGLLKQNLLKYRSKILRKHVHNQFVAIASHLPRQDWESHPVDVEDTNFTPTADLWQKILENKPGAPSKSILERINTQDVDARGKKLQSENDPKTSLDGLEANEDSAMQLVNLHSSKLPSTTDLCEIAHEKAGLLKKELQFAKSCCDPELTESSSDEDFEEAYEVVSKKTKMNLKANTKPRVTRYRKSFCRWVAERAEISRKWTWLQSRIAGMEFQIRNQGDLYNQLRSNKGMVRLVPQSSESNDRVGKVAADMNEADDSIYTTEAQTSSSSPPCSINHVLDNVNHQASRLMDTLSPVSGGWPSPVQELKTSESSSSVPNVQSATPSCHNESSLEVEDQCARTIALDRFMFKTRKLVRINQKRLDGSNSLKPATVPNDSSIMCPEQKRRSTSSRQIENYSSLILKAAVHDHSYHATISSLKDIPLSSSIQAVMKSKHKWSKKSDRNKKDKPKKATRKVKKSEKKLQRSLNANHLEEVVEKKRRRLASQLSEVSSRKRTAGSMDSDLDSQVVIGGFNSHQFAQGSMSGTTTPTSEMFASSQNNWKKKKLTEQTFDINNIVIPHGLNTPRIEKLVYKEIQTPSWKFLNVTTPDTPQENKNNLSADKVEDTSDAIFQSRHENYEISEKKKFMSLVQSRRSRRGFRSSTMRESTAQDPASPMPVSGEGEPHSRVVDTLQTVSSSQPISTTSPTAKPGAVRRLSGDHFTREQGPPSPHTLPPSQRNLDTLYAACPSPTAPLCPSGPGSRQNSHDNPAHIQRTLSCNINKVEEANCDGWEIRDFPLSEEDVKFLDDIDLAKTMLRGNSHIGTMYRSLDGEDTGRHSSCRTQNSERNLHDYTKLGLNDASRDTTKFTARRRTDSRGSSLASLDDSARHSDASSTSVSSSRRKKKGWHGASEVLSHRNGNMSGKGSKKLTSRKSKHKYMHVRLSETDDSSTDSDGDTTDSSCTSDDAGHLIDDFADPEWEAPRPRERR